MSNERQLLIRKSTLLVSGKSDDLDKTDEIQLTLQLTNTTTSII
jgi:hypothetical protein